MRWIISINSYISFTVNFMTFTSKPCWYLPGQIFSGRTWNPSEINACIKSLKGVDGEHSEYQVSTINICVKNNITEDINNFYEDRKKVWGRRSRCEGGKLIVCLCLFLNWSLSLLYISILFYITCFELPHATYEE